MLILPDSQSLTHSSSPPLMLPAPKIAGLLGEGPHPNPSPARRGAKPEQVLFLPFPLRGKGPGDEGFSFTFADPQLERLSADQRQKLFAAAATLLEIATRFSLGELNDNALRAATSLFARKLTGEPPKRYQNPAHFRAEQDSALLDWLLKVEKRTVRHE